MLFVYLPHTLAPHFKEGLPREDFKLLNFSYLIFCINTDFFIHLTDAGWKHILDSGDSIMDIREKFVYLPLSAHNLFAKSKWILYDDTVYLDNCIFEFVG